MDLIAHNINCKPHHLNWTGWRAMGDLLDDVGADLSAMAGSNDGDVVDADTASAWADALEVALDTVIVVEVPDNSYFGGKRTHLRVLAAQIHNPTQAVDPVRQLIAESGVFPQLNDEIEQQRRVVPSVRDATYDDLVWVRNFVAFLRTSGGFAQC